MLTLAHGVVCNTGSGSAHLVRKQSAQRSNGMGKEGCHRGADVENDHGILLGDHA